MELGRGRSPGLESKIEDDYPQVFAIVEAVEACATEHEAAYICFMAVRLIECRRILKPTGSIYVHCDDHANSYLRLLMDAIFGMDNLRNQITWRRATAHNDAKRFGRNTDTLLYYAMSGDFTWNGQDIAEPRTEDQLKAAYPQEDERGRYRSGDLTGPSHGAEPGSPSTLPWRGYDVLSRDRVWSAPRTGNYAEYIEANFIPGYPQIEGVHARLDALDAAGLIHHPESWTMAGAETIRRRLTPATLPKP